jgi:predicted secreted protein
MQLFDDARSKSVIFLAHCILNQNAISDGTATLPASMDQILDLLRASKVGIVQMPCPELNCLGLDRMDAGGRARPVVVENSRIRILLSQKSAADSLADLADQVGFQIREYVTHGFAVKGVVGINRSPSCGVETTSMDNQEVFGAGLFIEALRRNLGAHCRHVGMVGIKASEMDKAIVAVESLLNRHKNQTQTDRLQLTDPYRR